MVGLFFEWKKSAVTMKSLEGGEVGEEEGRGKEEKKGRGAPGREGRGGREAISWISKSSLEELTVE